MEKHTHYMLQETNYTRRPSEVDHFRDSAGYTGTERHGFPIQRGETASHA